MREGGGERERRQMVANSDSTTQKNELTVKMEREKCLLHRSYTVQLEKMSFQESNPGRLGESQES